MHLLHVINKGASFTEVVFINKAKQTKVNIGMHSETSKSISFNLGVMIDKTEFDMFLQVWMTLTFTQDQLSEKAKSP